MEVDLMGVRFFNRNDEFGLRCSSYILRCQTIYTIRLERTSEQIARILSTVVSPPATRSMFVCRRGTPGICLKVTVIESSIGICDNVAGNRS